MIGCLSRAAFSRAALSLATCTALLLAPLCGTVCSAAQQTSPQNQTSAPSPAQTTPTTQGPEQPASPQQTPAGETPAQQGASAPDQNSDQQSGQQNQGPETQGQQNPGSDQNTNQNNGTQNSPNQNSDQQVPTPQTPAGQAKPEPQTPGAQVAPGQPQSEPATQAAQAPSPIEQAPPAQQTASPNSPSGAPLPQSTTPEAPRDVRASFSRDYSKSNRAFPNLLGPYFPMYVEPADTANTANIHQLIQDGKLMLSIDDVVTLALQNNLNVNIARYTPFLAETDVLRSKSGETFLGTQTLPFQPSIANIPSIIFDPLITANVNLSNSILPVNNPFISGVGTTSANGAGTGTGSGTGTGTGTVIPTTTILGVGQHSFVADLQYQEGFHTGTTVTVAWDNTRSSSAISEDLFNPSVAASLTITVTQQLLNGFGTAANTRYIVEAKNERQAADFYFATQVISTIVTAENAYWELVYDRENVKVEEAALATSTKLYGDNKRQLEIGTMAPLDVLTAESEVATDRQNLILAQTTQLQQQTVLLNDITKQLMDPSLANIEIVPTTPIQQLPDTNVAPLEQAVEEAFSKRPELKQSELLLKNAGIDVKATRNALLPILSVFGTYGAQGLAGNSTTAGAPTAFSTDINAPIVNVNGAPVFVNGAPVYVGQPSAFAPGTTGASGFLDAQSALFHNEFPTYEAGLNLVLPIRNRAAQADNARAQLNQRMDQVQLLQMQNSVAVNVRNAQIALQQDRAQVDAAMKATELARQTLSAEQKKYALGASTSYNVILRSRDLTTAQGNELRARANLQEAMVNYDQALGRTLEVNHVTVAENRHGQTDLYRTPNIPGAFANVRLLSPYWTPPPAGN